MKNLRVVNPPDEIKQTGKQTKSTKRRIKLTNQKISDKRQPAKKREQKL